MHPSTVIGIVGLISLYEWRRRVEGTERRPAFYVALFIMFFSLNAWLHDLSDSYLFSAHMVQASHARARRRAAADHGDAGELLRPAR